LGEGRDEGAVELVIFDCDGVLIDSEPIANRVFARELESVGIFMTTDEVIRTFIGRSRDTCIEMAGRMRGEPLPADFGRRWDAAFHEALENEVKPVAGVAELLRTLTLPYCVASNGEPFHMRLGLTAAGLMPLVEGRLFSAAQVAHPKPAPDLFLHAAKTMGYAPERCAVIEDTPTGVKAGVAAGMKVFAYVGATHADHDALRASGGTLFTEMSSLPALLGIA
jgi:HAD superfamily hydrolase (TIGR01509 family)